MAIGVYFNPTAMSADQYGQCLKALQKAGAGHPPGRSYHATFGPKEKLMVFDVWTSQTSFDKFGKTLMPILQSLGIEGQPVIMPMHKVILPAARKASPARKKATSAKGAKKAAAGRRR